MTQIPEVTGYIEKLETPHREICERLRAMIFDQVPGVIEEYKWSRPVYRTGEGPIGYIQAVKTHVNLGFNRGAELDDPHGLLEGTGKDMRHIKLRTVEDVQPEKLGPYLRGAQALLEG